MDYFVNGGTGLRDEGQYSVPGQQDHNAADKQQEVFNRKEEKSY